ncbi:trem-like transcript 4 protein isoform X3 [Pogona vitticeps]
MRVLGTLSLLGWVITPGCWGLYCPDEVHPSVGGSLSVSCQYKQGLEKYSKFWCKETARIYCSALVKSQSDGKGIKQRISIRDNKEKQYFEVIMSNLTKEDSGVYRCGIDDSLLPFRDSTCRIHVAVSPAPTLDPEEEQTTSKLTEKLQTTKRHKKLSPTEPPDADGFTEGTSESSSFSASTRHLHAIQKIPTMRTRSLITPQILMELGSIRLLQYILKITVMRCTSRKSLWRREMRFLTPHCFIQICSHKPSMVT